MTWAKVDAGLHLNPKVRMAGADAREVFIYIVLANAANAADGVLAGHYADATFLADALQRDEETVRNALKRCVTFRLLHISAEEVSIVGWDSQWRVPSSTNRVQKHRERKRLQALEAYETLRNVTETQSNVTETHVTPKREREEREERKKDNAHRPEAPTYDFDMIYSLYPRKVGKARGLALCRSKVKSQVKYELMLASAKEMCSLWRGRNKEQKEFCPMFDTWVSKGRWQEDEQVGPGSQESTGGKVSKLNLVEL